MLLVVIHVTDGTLDGRVLILGHEQTGVVAIAANLGDGQRPTECHTVAFEVVASTSAVNVSMPMQMGGRERSDGSRPRKGTGGRGT